MWVVGSQMFQFSVAAFDAASLSDLVVTDLSSMKSTRVAVAGGGLDALAAGGDSSSNTEEGTVPSFILKTTLARGVIVAYGGMLADGGASREILKLNPGTGHIEAGG